jgi:hypothetical protein
MRYMSEHAIWLTDNVLSQGRLMHLTGKFEKTLDSPGALKTYVESRVDDQSLRKLSYDPDIQRSLGLVRGGGESREQFEARVFQAQSLYGLAKFDVALLLAQLHFDRGDYRSSVYWLETRLLNSPQSQRWQAPGWHLLARGFIELDSWEQAEQALIKPSIEESMQESYYAVNPQDPGNRLRLRLLRRLETQRQPQDAD